MTLGDARRLAKAEAKKNKVPIAVIRDPYDEHNEQPENQYGYVAEAGLHCFPHFIKIEVVR